MGQLYADFGIASYRNESEVSQNFVLPLLQKYLGYHLNEILPERNFPARGLNSGVNFNSQGTKGLTHKPDFVICLDGDVNHVKFIIDSKAPSENVDDHLGQLRSYSNSVGRNFLMVTNGTCLKVFNVNDLIFFSDTIHDLQLKLPELIGLLGRASQALKHPIQILKELDYEKATGSFSNGLNDEVTRRRVVLSDFLYYLQTLKASLQSWHLPSDHFKALDNLEIEQLDPRGLLTFLPYSGTESPQDFNQLVRFNQIERDTAVKIKVLTGDTGSGKSTLLRFLTYQAASDCLAFRSIKIPVLIALREITASKPLETLIQDALGRLGYVCSSYHEVLNTNDFVFFLDAYDEVPVAFLLDADHSIRHLGGKFVCYVTTRPHRIPQFSPSETFVIQPLEADQVESIAKLYLPDNHYAFNEQLNSNGLTKESGNLLLMLLLLSLFKENGRLPGSIYKAIMQIVARARDWQKTKVQDLNPQLPHEIIELIMSDLAYNTICSGKTTITIDAADKIIIAVLDSAERSRKIIPGLTVQDVYRHLQSTGLVILAPDYLYFWHRMFLNYFASSLLSRNILLNDAAITRYKDDPDWEVVIIGVASQVVDTTLLLNALQGNVWLSAYCLSENANCEDETKSRIITELILLAGSNVLTIRERAMSYLLDFDSEQVTTFFREAFTNSCFPDVRMKALIAMAKERSDKAWTLINGYLDWDESDFFTGMCSQSSIARALSFFGEEGHLQIIENWKKFHSFQLGYQCKSIFSSLYAKGQFTSKLVRALKLFFVEEYRQKKHGSTKLDLIGDILAKVQDITFVPVLLRLVFGNDDIGKMRTVSKLLKSYQSKDAVFLILDSIFKHPGKKYALDYCTKAAVESTCSVPLEVFVRLTQHSEDTVIMGGIEGLSRFEYESVKHLLPVYLNGSHPQLQSAAFSVLVSKGEIVNFARHHDWPEVLFLPSVHTILEGIRKYGIIEALDLLERVKSNLFRDGRYLSEYYLSFDLAVTYQTLGEVSSSGEVIGWFFDGAKFLQTDKVLHQNLMRAVCRLQMSIAEQIALCFARTYLLQRTEEYLYEEEVFIEAAESMKISTLKEVIKELVLFHVSMIQSGSQDSAHRIERPLRALVKIGSAEDEEWIVDNMSSFNYPSGLASPQLRRAVECFANFGSLKSIQIVQDIGRANLKDEIVVNTCQLAIENICRRERISCELYSLS